MIGLGPGLGIGRWLGGITGPGPRITGGMGLAGITGPGPRIEIHRPLMQAVNGGHPLELVDAHAK